MTNQTLQKLNYQKTLASLAKELHIQLPTIKNYVEYLNIPTFSKPIKLDESGVNSIKDFVKSTTPKERRNLLYTYFSQKNYGVEHPNQLQSIKEKTKQTCIKKYGVECPAQSSEVIQKSKQTCIEKYGTDNVMHLDNFKKKCSESFKNFETNIKKELEKELGVKLVPSTYVSRFLLERDPATFNKFLSKNNFTVYKRGCHNFVKESDLEKIEKMYSLHTGGVSTSEKEIVDCLKGFYSGPIIENDKKILNGKELDVYLPERKLAIEYNGLYWHSDKAHLSSSDIPDREERTIAKYRHLEKTKACEEKGIRLIHIFEDDWHCRKEIVIGILKASLGIYDKKIFARKCTVENLPNKAYKDFLKNNHLQGYSPADVRLGLYYEGELVECIGINSKGLHSSSPELVRLCSKNGFQILGGFSKLLKHSGLSHIVSYIDRGTFSGLGYKKVGFKVEKVNNPTYHYVRVPSLERLPRYAFRKNKIKKLFEKGVLSYWNPDETEEVNMYKNGYGRIWNCGTVRVLYEN